MGWSHTTGTNILPLMNQETWAINLAGHQPPCKADPRLRNNLTQAVSTQGTAVGTDREAETRNAAGASGTWTGGRGVAIRDGGEGSSAQAHGKPQGASSSDFPRVPGLASLLVQIRPGLQAGSWPIYTARQPVFIDSTPSLPPSLSLYNESLVPFVCFGQLKSFLEQESAQISGKENSASCKG